MGIKDILFYSINIDFNEESAHIIKIIRRGFVPGFVYYKKGCTRLAAASDRVYQLLAHGRWFSSGTPASSGVKHQKSNEINQINKKWRG
jgi:hypothetical protein